MNVCVSKPTNLTYASLRAMRHPYPLSSLPLNKDSFLLPPLPPFLYFYLSIYQEARRFLLGEG